jgi:hypothetical protein
MNVSDRVSFGYNTTGGGAAKLEHVYGHGVYARCRNTECEALWRCGDLEQDWRRIG